MRVTCSSGAAAMCWFGADGPAFCLVRHAQDHMLQNLLDGVTDMY